MDSSREELQRRIRQLEDELVEERKGLAEARQQLNETRTNLDDTRRQLDSTTLHLQTLTNTVGFRALQSIRQAIDGFAPWGTRRRGFLLAVSRAAYIAFSEGRRGVLARAKGVLRWGPRFWAKAPRVPPAAPLDARYALWLEKHRLTEEDKEVMRKEALAFSYRPLLSIVTPVYNTDPTILRAAIQSVRDQLYDRWELCLADDGSTNLATRAEIMRHVYMDERIKVKFLVENKGIAVASSEALSLATGDFLGLMDHDDELQPNALFEVVKLLNHDPDLDYVYSDEDKREVDGRRIQPFFKPNWSPDLLLSMNYLAHFSVFRADLVKKLGGFRVGFDGSQDYDLVLRVTEKTDRIAHIPQPLYTWRKIPESAAASREAKPYTHEAGKKALAEALARRSTDGTVLDGLVTGEYYRVKYAIADHPKVGIVIPTRDHANALKRCVDSIRAKTTYRNYEIVVVDNESKEPETAHYLSSVGLRVIPCAGTFNFSNINNLAASKIECDMLLFLNNDTEVISPEWLEAMVEHCQRPGVGATGARLLYRDGRVQHEGVLVGCRTLAGNIDHHGYFSLGQVIRNVSAVTAACMMTRAAVFEEIGGFDEDLPVAFNDVDYCLRLRQLGYVVVYTPYALLYHDEGGTRGRVHPLHDEVTFRSRWLNSPMYTDPYYNPNLDIDHPFTLNP